MGKHGKKLDPGDAYDYVHAMTRERESHPQLLSPAHGPDLMRLICNHSGEIITSPKAYARRDSECNGGEMVESIATLVWHNIYAVIDRRTRENGKGTNRQDLTCDQERYNDRYIHRQSKVSMGQ